MSATAQTEADDPAQSMEAGTGRTSDGRERAYLKERNKVLSAKLEQREATIDELQARVETLESELTDLRTSSESTAQDQTTRDDGSDSSSRSLWEKAKRLVDGSHS